MFIITRGTEIGKETTFNLFNIGIIMEIVTDIIEQITMSQIDVR